MYVIEVHEANVDDVRRGSLLGRIGRRYAHLSTRYLTELHLSNLNGTPWHRVYGFENDQLVVVWARCPDLSLRYVVCVPKYNSRPELPYLYPYNRLVIGHYGVNADSIESGEVWAREVFSTSEEVATAVLLDPEGVYAAWERTPEVTLLARRPS